MLKTFLIMVCYGRYNSFRIVKIAMQDITELFQYAFSRITHISTSFSF